MNQLYQFNHPATGCAKCPDLLPGRHHVVWSRGPTPASVMVIGEAPGYNEDMQGLPFVGRAGQYADRLLHQAGIPPKQVHFASRIMCRPPGNRDPEPEEVRNCLPWLIEHIRLVQPRGIVLFGRFALQLFFDRDTVKDTIGLMHTQICHWCGGRDGVHTPERGWASNGTWTSDRDSPRALRTPPAPWIRPTIEVPAGQCGMKSHPVTVASIYHPAYVARDAPEHEPTVVHQLRRLREELEHNGITFDEEEQDDGQS